MRLGLSSSLPRTSHTNTPAGANRGHASMGTTGMMEDERGPEEGAGSGGAGSGGSGAAHPADSSTSGAESQHGAAGGRGDASGPLGSHMNGVGLARSSAGAGAQGPIGRPPLAPSPPTPHGLSTSLPPIPSLQLSGHMGAAGSGQDRAGGASQGPLHGHAGMGLHSLGRGMGMHTPMLGSSPSGPLSHAPMMGASPPQHDFLLAMGMSPSTAAMLADLPHHLHQLSMYAPTAARASHGAPGASSVTAGPPGHVHAAATDLAPGILNTGLAQGAHAEDAALAQHAAAAHRQVCVDELARLLVARQARITELEQIVRDRDRKIAVLECDGTLGMHPMPCGAGATPIADAAMGVRGAAASGAVPQLGSASAAPVAHHSDQPVPQQPAAMQEDGRQQVSTPAQLSEARHAADMVAAGAAGAAQAGNGGSTDMEADAGSGGEEGARSGGANNNNGSGAGSAQAAGRCAVTAASMHTTALATRCAALEADVSDLQQEVGAQRQLAAQLAALNMQLVARCERLKREREELANAMASGMTLRQPQAQPGPESGVGAATAVATSGL